MMKAKKTALVLSASTLLFAAHARAGNVTLLDQHDWQVLIGGFAEADMYNDSTRSFNEVVGNNPVIRNGASASLAPNAGGVNGQTQFSIQNSRIDFTVLAPKVDGWKDKAYLEFDLLGFEPGIGTNGNATESQTAYFENATLRVRHAYADAQKGSWHVLLGQTWDLFGYSPTYVLDTVSLSPVRGDLYERTPQLTVFNTQVNSDNSLKLETALSMERPVQMASQVPGFDAAMRFSLPQWSGVYFDGSSSDVWAAPFQIAISGKINTFNVPGDQYSTAGAPLAQNVSSTSMASGGAVALMTIIPVITADPTTDYATSLVFTGEFTAGSGYGDEFSGWSGGINQFTGGGALGHGVTGLPVLDSGQGGYYANGSFHLMQLESFNFSAQYNLPKSWATYLNGGYSQLRCFNIGQMTNSSNFDNNGGGLASLYNLSQGAFININHDFTKQFRLGFEYDRFLTGYVLNNVYAADNRYQLSAWFHF